MKDLQGKTALVTGGATGIGKALARELAQAGMTVTIASTNAGRLDAAAAELRGDGLEIFPAVCDVADRDAVEALARALEARHGPLDLLCANAGVTTFGPFVDHRSGDWDWVTDVVFKGVANCVQAFYPGMVARKSGHIMLTGSQTALAPDWVLQHGPYIAAKAAVHALAFSLRPEAAEHGVGVTLFVPAATETDVEKGQRSRQQRYGEALQGEVKLRADAPPPLADYPFFLSAEDAAARAIQGIRDNAAIVVTHAGMKPLVADWFDRVLAAYDAAAAFPDRAS